MSDTVLVSIVCNTFNHEKYIKDALEGFVNQKTEYSFEILVYDDASTDKTASIIRQYEEKYPHLIKPIYQTVNQYSRGLRPGQQNRDRAKGKYVAMCEGDDFWTDEYKLQKQISYMEAHPDCTFCFSNGYVHDGIQLQGKIIPWDKYATIKKDSFDYNIGEVEMLGYIPTASFVYRNGLPTVAVSDAAFKGDAYHKLSKTLFGYAHYFEEPMCAYRRNVTGSATDVWVKNPTAYAKQCDSFIALFTDFQEITEHKYDAVFKMRVCQWKINKYYALRDYAELKKIAKSKELRYLKTGNRASVIAYTLKCKYTKLFVWLRSMRTPR